MRGVSLFSNCGAGDIGYARAGFSFAVMAEKDPRRLAIAIKNHPSARPVVGDLNETWSKVITEYRQAVGKARPALLAACPPCQGMSSVRSNKGYLDDGTQDKRNLLVEVIANVAAALEPRAIVVENIPHFLTRLVKLPGTRKSVVAARLLIDRLEQRYAVFPLVCDLADYGVPQTRRRAFLTFFRKGETGLEALQAAGLTPYPVPSHASDHGGRARVSVREALLELAPPQLDAASVTGARLGGANSMHVVPVWLDHRYDMVAAIPPNSGRSAWENDRCLDCDMVVSNLARATCPGCDAALPRPVLKGRNGKYRLIHGFRQSTYRRMLPDAPAPTITTATGHVGSHTTIHPWENRLLSPLECAYLQTFPRDFRWGYAMRELGGTNVRDMIGEAVPPRFTRKHGAALAKVLENVVSRRSSLLSADDARCKRARRTLGLS